MHFEEKKYIYIYASVSNFFFYQLPIGTFVFLYRN